MSGYTTLARVKAQAGISDTTDDAVLQTYVDATNAEMIRRIGIDLGPSSDTLRLYDGNDAVRYGSRLWVAGGIRTLTQVRIASCTGGTLTTATLGDFLLRPKAQDRRTGMPAMRLDISDASSSVFYAGYDNIELTGTFGYAAVPEDLAKLGDMIVLRMWEDRNAGGATAPTPSKFIFGDDRMLLDTYRFENFPMAA
jgi:Phage gp6-like head-tail connector protein